MDWEKNTVRFWIQSLVPFCCLSSFEENGRSNGPRTWLSTTSELDGCLCTIIHQFGLPCQHQLASILLSSPSNSISIPIELLHPRWKIDEQLTVTPSVSWIIPPPVAPVHPNHVIYRAHLALPLIQHDLYHGNGQDLLLKSLQDLELLQAELVGENAEVAGLVVQWAWGAFTVPFARSFSSVGTSMFLSEWSFSLRITLRRV